MNRLCTVDGMARRCPVSGWRMLMAALWLAVAVCPLRAWGDERPVESSWWRKMTDGIGITDSNRGVMARMAAKEYEKTSPDYLIGPGDVIGISVWRDENLTRTVVVLPDGKIAYPLLGEVVAGNKTVAQLKKELETGLTRYISDTNVSVEVKQSNSMIIYIIGRVNAPGKQFLIAKTNVLQGLAMAGGLNPFAQKGDIRIFRQEQGKTVMFPFDYDDVMDGRRLETNIELKRGDVIIVP